MGRDDWQGTGNKYVDGAITLIAVTCVLLVGTIVIGNFCTVTYQNVANNPQALQNAHQLCGTFWQSASNYLLHLI